MSVTSRQRLILNKLLAAADGATVKQLADEAEVSTRTIHRELTEMEGLLAQYNLELVKKAGTGICIVGDEATKEDLILSLYSQTTVEYAPEERKTLILCQLLEAVEPVKLVSLAYDLKVTNATISYDLDELVTWLAEYDLTLIRRRGYGVELHGSEAAKRKAMSALLADHLNEAALLGIVKENIHGKTTRHVDSVSERLLGLIEKEKLIMIENSLRTLEEELTYPLADSSFVGLVIHLALAIERLEKGEKISFDADYLNELAATPEFAIADKIIQKLQTIFQLDIPEAEIGYITMHLRGAKLRTTQDNWLAFQNIELVSKVHQLIRFCEDKLDISFQEDATLAQGLLTHIEPALFRIQKKMHIRNPLLEEIKERYRELFDVLRQAAAVVFPEISVPDEEIGYLVMHLGASMERMVQYGGHYRALVVCSSGIGSSKILASRIKKELPYISHVQNASLFDIDKIPDSDYDLIISTVPLALDAQTYALVSPLLTKEDIQSINQFLRTRQRRPLEDQAFFPKTQEHVLYELKTWQSYISHILDLAETFSLAVIDNRALTIEDIIGDICQELQAARKIRSSRVVADKLLERQNLGGLGIPDTQLALFHSRNAETLSPVFRLYYFQEPIVMKSMEGKLIAIDKLLLLLAPENISKEGLAILSEISALLVEEDFADVLADRDRKKIAAYFLNHLYTYIVQKIKKER